MPIAQLPILVVFFFPTIMMENFFLRTDQSARISAVDPHATKGLFVGDLSSFCTEKDLHYLFSEFGNITNVEIKRGRHGDSLLHGFVEFDSETSAHLAIQGLHGRKFKGRKMRLVFFFQIVF